MNKIKFKYKWKKILFFFSQIISIKIKKNFELKKKIFLIIFRLEDEMFDTKESLKLIDAKTWENFKFP
jgi:hypothetical protein